MVEDRVTDGERIAQLLASELTGLERGPLAAVSVVDADRDAEPSPDGPTAYRVAVDDEPVGRVRLYEAAAVVELDGDAGAIPDRLTGDDLRVEESDAGVALRVSTGAAVKRAADAVAAVLAA